MTSPATSTPSRRGGSREMYARSVTVPSVGLADTATPCVLRRRFQASVTRRGCAERPRDRSLRPSAESGLEVVNRCLVFPAGAASDGASIPGTLRDASGRLWLAGPAPVLPSTEATTVASTPRADGQMGENVDPSERVRPTGGAGQDSRAEGPYAWTGPTGAQRPSGRRYASPVECSPAARTSTIFARTQYWRGTTVRTSFRWPRATSSRRHTARRAASHLHTVRRARDPHRRRESS